MAKAEREGRAGPEEQEALHGRADNTPQRESGTWITHTRAGTPPKRLQPMDDPCQRTEKE